MTSPLIEFKAWPKTPRLFRDCVITEKIDGSNAAIGIMPSDNFAGYTVYAQSRNRIITPGKTTDNYGFATWVEDNFDTLIADLGPGLHFGEWWGQGIARHYDMPEKRFSLFNTHRYADVEFATPQLGVVPVLYEGPFTTIDVHVQLTLLGAIGSKASPGFMNPEGVVIYHTASKQIFKALIENDDIPKGAAA